MLNLDLICQRPDYVREALRRRGEAPDIDTIIHLAEQRRGLVARSDSLYASLKQLKDQVRHLTDQHRRGELNQQIKLLSTDIRKLEIATSEAETHLQLYLLRLPNLPHESVPVGNKDDSGNVMYQWGNPLRFSFQPLPHWDLGTRLNIIDAEMGARIAGSHFVALRGMGARLERALISYMLDVHTQEHGYGEVMPPFLVKNAVMQGSGQLPKFADQVYSCDEDDLYLNPTAEVPLLGIHSDSVLSQEMLPLRYVAWTPAFRRESVSSSRRHRGLLRLHQFNKVELFQYVLPDQSASALVEMLQHASTILQRLELAYRVVLLNSSQLPFTAAKTFDIEVWMPGMNEYIEVSSVSNCETFQARRANIRYRATGQARTSYVETLNASGLAVGRTMAAILEAYQQADGSVIVPKVLRPYMGVSVLSPAEESAS